MVAGYNIFKIFSQTVLKKLEATAKSADFWSLKSV
jgi:hypothetical protein